jgi:hypothetical protein
MNAAYLAMIVGLLEHVPTIVDDLKAVAASLSTSDPLRDKVKAVLPEVAKAIEDIAASL